MKHIFLAQHCVSEYYINCRATYDAYYELDIDRFPKANDLTTWRYKNLKILLSTLRAIYMDTSIIKKTWETVKSIDNSGVALENGDKVLINNEHCIIQDRELDVENRTMYFYLDKIYIKADEPSRSEALKYMSKLRKFKEEVEKSMQIIENRKWYDKLKNIFIKK